jgi:hypothetical protein
MNGVKLSWGIIFLKNDLRNLSHTLTHIKHSEILFDADQQKPLFLSKQQAT